jgi:hypothetical protein
MGLVPMGLVSTAYAADAPAPAASLSEARVWLSRIHNAAISSNYQGTMVFSSAGGVLSSSRVWHYCVGDQTYERMEALDGRQQHIVRHNDAVHTLWPQSRVAVVEKRETLAAWSTTPQSVDPQALEQYELRREGMTRVAGREAVVLLLEPRDALRYAQRLWADAASGLMLRADVIDQTSARRGPSAACSSRPRFLKSRSVFARSLNKCCKPCGASKATGCCGRSSSAPRWRPKVGCWPAPWRASGLRAACAEPWKPLRAKARCCKACFPTA